MKVISLFVAVTGVESDQPGLVPELADVDPLLSLCSDDNLEIGGRSVVRELGYLTGHQQNPHSMKRSLNLSSP